MSVMDIEQVMQYLPHRYPFLLIDKVIELELKETDPVRARAAAEEMARKLLANTVIESFRVAVEGA